MRNTGMLIGITLFTMIMVILVYNFAMTLYRDYRKDKARELEFLNRKEDYQETIKKSKYTKE